MLHLCLKARKLSLSYSRSSIGERLFVHSVDGVLMGLRLEGILRLFQRVFSCRCALSADSSESRIPTEYDVWKS